MKQIVSILTLISIGGILLAGCGSKDTEAESLVGPSTGEPDKFKLDGANSTQQASSTVSTD